MDADKALELIEAGVPADPNDTKVQGILSHGGVFRAVVGELKAVGFSPLEILQLVTTIIDLIQTYGPVIADIVKAIRDRFNK